MGLDMYLTKRTYVKNWDHMTPEEKHKVTVKKGGKVRTDIKPERVSEIIEEVAYWRKANEIHNWFVKNVQKGQDDCREYYVSKEALESLLTLVEEVLAHPDKASEYLPTASGFFFGGTEYDEWYFEDLRYTSKALAKVLKDGDGSYYYSSSW